jgi:hypothetical protein
MIVEIAWEIYSGLATAGRFIGWGEWRIRDLSTWRRVQVVKFLQSKATFFA